MWLSEYTSNVIIAPGLKQLLQDIQVVFGGPIVHVVPHGFHIQSRLLFINDTFKIYTKKKIISTKRRRCS